MLKSISKLEKLLFWDALKWINALAILLLLKLIENLFFKETICVRDGDNFISRYRQ